MKKRPLPLFIFFLTLTTFCSCNSFSDLEFEKIENIKLNKFGLTESLLYMDIVYTNPNNTRLKLKKASGDAWIENNFLGNFLIDTSISIPAKGNFKLPVKLKVDMNKLLKSSILALLNPDVLIKINGNARVGKGIVFINYPIKYEGKQNLRELLK